MRFSNRILDQSQHKDQYHPDPVLIAVDTVYQLLSEIYIFSSFLYGMNYCVILLSDTAPKISIKTSNIKTQFGKTAET